MRLHHRMRAFTCFLHGKFFLLRLPALYVETSVPKLPCPPLAYQGSIWVFPALPHFTHFDVVHVSQRIAGRGSNRVGTDPRSWACILPAGECSSVRLVATAVQFAARAAASTRDPGAPPAWASARFCSSVKRGLPRVLVAQARNLPIGSCKRESHTTAMQCTLAAVKARSEWHVTIYICVCVCRTPNMLVPMQPGILAGRRITFSSRLHLHFWPVACLSICGRG